MKIKNLFSFIRRKKDNDLTSAERMIKRCPGAILEDLRSSEEELDQLEKTIEKTKKKIIADKKK